MLPALTAAVQRRLFHVFTPIGGTRAAPLSSAPQPPAASSSSSMESSAGTIPGAKGAIGFF